MSHIPLIKGLVRDLVFREVDDNDPLYTSRLLDSMGTVELAVMLENELNIKIDVSEIIIENFDSIAKLNDFVVSKLSHD